MLKKNLHWLYLPLFLLSCAKQGAPTGGPKDTIPPVLIRTIPRHEAVNVSPRSIELEFNEMVDASAAKDQLIITPSLGKNFEVRTKKNSVILDLKKPLEENTTYSFNFRESVKDVTERNPAKKLNIAISTGPYLDSLSISGNISDLIKGKIYKEATVAVHTQNDTFSILKHPASIVTKTDDKGNFKIDYLKPDYYYLYAFDDKNKNLIVDSRTEAFNFFAYPIKLQKDTAKINLGLINLDTRPLKLTSARPYNTYFNVKFSKNLSTFELTKNTGNLSAAFGEDHANIKIYPQAPTQDSLQFSIHAMDSIGQQIDTTLYAKFTQREVTREKFTSELKDPSLIAITGALKFQVKFNKPIKLINLDSAYYQIDSTHVIPFKLTDFTWNYPENVLTVVKTLDKTRLLKPETENQPQQQSKPATTSTPPAQKKTTGKETEKKKPIVANQLTLAEGTFISVDNDTSKILQQQLPPQQPNDLSEIIYNVRSIYPNILVQLLNKDFEILAQQSNAKGSFKNLSAGTYILRAVIDENKNNKWDPGNYLRKEQPEKIFYYRGGEKQELEIQLKSAWELELAPLFTTY